MMSRRLLIILLIVLLVGCMSSDSVEEVETSTQPPTAAETETPTLTFTPTVSLTPTRQRRHPTYTPSPTATPTYENDPYIDTTVRYQEGVIPPAAHKRLGMGFIWDLQVSPDRRAFALGTTTGVYVFDSRTEELLWSAATRAVARKIKWSPYGDKLAASLPDTDSILVWDAGGQFLMRLETANLSLPFDWSPNGKQIVTGQTWYDESERIYHGTLTIFNVETGEEAGYYELDPGQDSAVTAVAGLQWSPDGRYIIVGTFSKFVTHVLDLWGDTFLGLHTTFDHEDNRYLDFSPDGSRLLTYSGWIQAEGPEGSEYAVIWDMDSFEMVDVIEPDADQWHTSDAGWSPDGRYVAVTYPQYFVIWDTAAGKEVYSYHDEESYFDNLIWSPDGTTLIITMTDLMEHYGDGPESGELWFVDLSNTSQISIAREPTSWPTYSGWLPDERLLLATDEDLYVRDMLTQRYASIIRSSHRCLQLGRSPDSPIFAALLWDGSMYDVIDARYWDYQTWEPLIAESDRANLPPDDWTYSTHPIQGPHELAVPANLTYLLDRTPDGSGDFGPNKITLMDGDRTILDYIDYDLNVYSSAISPDGRYLAFGFGTILCHYCPIYGTVEQAYILLFDTETETSTKLYGHTGWVTSLLFLPDGNLVSASKDGTIIVWNVP